MSTTVLIIDDDPVQRRLAEAMVRRLGFEARIAENGHDGLNLLRGGENVDVVLLDLVMPGGMDGLSVLAEMRLVFHLMGDDPGFHTPYLDRNVEIVELLEGDGRAVAATALRAYLGDARDHLLGALGSAVSAG